MKHFVYIVECRDGSLYTGYTTDVEKRLWEHNFGKRGAKSIRGKLPVKLAHSEAYSFKSAALKREMEIKSWNKSKKMKLVSKK